MKLNNIILLIKRHLLKDGKKVILGMAALWLVFILLTIVTQLNETIDLDFYHTIMLMLLMFGGSIITSLMFSESSEISSGYQYSTLPVSVLDKLSAAWVISFPLFVICWMVLYYTGLGIFTTINSLGFPVNEIEKSFLIPISEQFQMFILLHGFCLLAAAWFKKYPIIKAGMLSSLIGFSFFVKVGLTLWLVKPYGSMMSNTADKTVWHFNDNFFRITTSDSMWSIIICSIVSLFFITVAYFKLKERAI